MTACALIAAPKLSPPAGTPPIIPGSAVSVIRSVIFSSLATFAMPSGMPIPRLTTLLAFSSMRGAAGNDLSFVQFHRLD